MTNSKYNSINTMFKDVNIFNFATYTLEIRKTNEIKFSRAQFTK